MYGAGNIGRGFIGALFSQSGYEVTFIDIAKDTVKRLHSEGHYPVRIVTSEGNKDLEITNVDAINGNDIEAVIKAIAEADIMATAVGANILKFIVPNIVAGIRKRLESSGQPLNILICENLMDANHILENMIKEKLPEDEHGLFDKKIGLVETSIGRMVPVQTAEMQDGDPLRVCVEQYGFLPVDKDAFKGDIPNIERMIPFSPFDFYLKRKLYLHNMGHAICAYLGMYTGIGYIWETMEDSQIRLIVKEAMCESMSALAQEYSVPMQEILRHSDDLLIRFTNRALADTCVRVCSDAARKLNVSDRLIGAANLCLKHNILPTHIAIGAAGALYQYLNEKEIVQKVTNAEVALKELSGLCSDDDLGTLVLEMYDLYRRGTNPGQLRKMAENRKRSVMIGII